jgi:hypothetical protein
MIKSNKYPQETKKKHLFLFYIDDERYKTEEKKEWQCVNLMGSLLLLKKILRLY